MDNLTLDNPKKRKKKDVDYVAIKCKLDTILRFPEWKPIILDRVTAVNKIWVETYFLFNLHILRLLKTQKNVNFDYNTIERCALFVLGKENTIRGASPEDKKEISDLQLTFNTNYKKMGANKVTQFNKIKSIKKPIEYLSRQIMTNIKNHCSLNFYRFQKKYLKFSVFDELAQFKLKKSVMYSILNCIQFHINSETDILTIRSNKIKNLSNLKEVITVMTKIINLEKVKLPEELKGKCNEKNLRSNFVQVLKYYYDLIKILEKNERKRFSILPQLNFGYTFIKFDSRLISTIYDEWAKGNGLETVGIKKFEAKYKEYYRKCFLFKENLKYKPNLNPITFMTNGYSAIILFENDMINKKEDYNDDIILDEYQPFKEHKRGLLDADNCKSSIDCLNEFHKISIDPNNSDMLYCYSESGQKIVVTKNYYLEKSHIKRNTKKMNIGLSQSGLKKVFSEMAETNYKKTIDIKNYKNFIKIYRKNWNILWDFYQQKKILKLELDNYIFKKKAIQKIVRKIVPKTGKTHKFNTKNGHNKYILDEDIFNVQNKPVLIFFGKGNGSTTISNLKNSEPKGPIKKIAKELSKVAVTILTDEYNTSQVCSDCKESKVEHPVIKCQAKRTIGKDSNGRRIKELIEVEKQSYKICYCKNNIHLKLEGVQKVWNRDFNSSRNILYVGTSKLLGGDLKIFSRKKREKETIICLSLDRQGDPKGNPNENKSEGNI